jgi:U3 small nucleolar RNA-associated protein 11
MSSLRNAVKRVTHKERSQPAARKKFGLLEKHKDYVERAQDYHKKQDYMKILKKKAADRNPDEFYFKMNNSAVNKKGIHKEKRDGSLDTSVVKLLKTQDMGYIVNKKVIDDRKVKKLQSSLHLIGDDKVGKKRKHKVFVDDEVAQAEFDVAEHLDTVPELVNHQYNRMTRGQLERLADSEYTAPSVEQIKKVLDKRNKAYKELEARAKRADKLGNAVKGLQQQRNMMSKGTKKIVDKDGKTVKKKKGDDEEDNIHSSRSVQYKWKRCRQK